MATIHEPVLLEEVLSCLNPQPNQNFIDCTFGGGGHALAILERIKPSGKLLGIDWDPAAVRDSQNENLILVNENYKNLRRIINSLKNGLGSIQISGILLDLGLSSDQLGSENRGFSFKDQGPLDLRFNPNEQPLTAADILNTSGEKELVEIFKAYGEEPLASIIAKEIIRLRSENKRIETADMLVQLVSNIYHRRFKSRSRTNPATRVFQALRIAVNDEYQNIKTVLPQAMDILAPQGRLAVISFHSGEDRIVKQFFKAAAKQESPLIKILTKKPIVPTEAEMRRNPRSRSAKLRAVEKL